MLLLDCPVVRFSIKIFAAELKCYYCSLQSDELDDEVIFFHLRPNYDVELIV